MNMQRASMLLVLLFSFFLAKSEGSKNLSPDSTGTTTGTNDIVGFLCHTQGNGNGGITGPFMSPSATADERLKVYIETDETLYMGFRRMASTFSGTITFGDLNVILRESDGTFVTSFLILADQSSVSGGLQDYAFQSPQNGVIDTYAEALAGPSTVVGSSGYSPISWTNNSGLGSQEFYIQVVQSTSGSGTVTSEADGNAIFVESRYDLWDISVYDGTTEKPGRLFCKSWGFTTTSFANQFSDDFQLFINIPSTVGGSSAGFYVKELDLAGLQPFTTSVFANSVGAEIAQTTDLNGDGSIDFQDARRSQGSNIADLEYDIFINNPDIDIYPTTTLPSVNITDAVFYCNSGGTAGEGVITIETNQSGVVGLVLDLDGAAGYDAGGTDVIIEATVDASSGSGTATIRWDGLDGTGSAVASGATINITGRFTAGPLHVPLWDPEQNVVGINMLDVRPQTSFDLIYWDDRSTTLDSSPNVELTGTNTGQHTWTDPSGTGAGGGNAVLVNTWSFGYFQSNTQNVAFTYACDTDGDGINDGSDSDSDNDGIADAVEGNFKNDTDADGIPDYLDADFAGYADTNADGVNDNFDTDLDGIPDALDVDSDNDGIPDMVENGLADTDLDGTVDNGSGITDTNDNGLDDNYDPACDGATVSGNATAQTNTGATNPANALGNTPGTFAEIASGDILTLDIGQIVPSGVTIVLSLNDGAAGINATANVSQSEDGTNFTNVQGYTATTGVDTAPFGPEDFNYVLTADARYIRLVEASGANRPVDVHMLSFSYTNCSGGSAVAIVDTDSDAISNYLDLDSDNDGIVDVLEVGGTVAATSGQINGFTDSNGNGLNDAQESVALSLTNTDGDGSLADYLDIDSDNDGILDNIEAQASNAVITIAAGDTDSDGLLDVYDPNNGGILLIPVDTDTDGADDYLDTDADGDGVADLIEGWDSDFNGFNDLESTTNDNDLSDETGYNVDADTDGLWDIYESSTAPVQNTDGAGLSDWQDTDDDDDGSLTSGEDVNSNNNWTDDKTQGQGAGSPLPDYLYRGDYDGDAIADGNDADSDNDGLTDATEDNGESIDPSGDEDNDGIANYRDTDDTGVTDNIVEVDSNSDGVWDNYDSDLDGIPDFLDLDSDGDGIWDAVEANGGAVPFGLNETTGQFELQDPDNDGLMNYVDTDDVSSSNPTSDLSNPDSDGDGLSDYQDIDSDGDGIPDNIEAQLTTTYVAPANNDADGDGIDDSYDPGSGGTKLDPVNSDTQDFQDYRDTDSDNDNVEDIVEGWDQDANGRGDWDDDLDGNQDEADLATDSDGDGLADAFDNVALGTTGNEAGSAATRQNTDGIDFPDWRDDNDDNDAANTIDEDNNSDGIYWNDQTGGQSGSIPDYLYNGDFDRDLIADTPDTDSDNDGIPDIDEDNGESVDPSGDIDGDGIPNFRDDDDPGVLNNIVEVDSNGDGVWDNYDSDLDGLPDFRDRDSDNDGIADLVEAGGVESDGDGVVDGLTDTDSDGIPDNVDVDQTGGNDSDSDGIDDLFDFSVAGGTDTDGDDIIDSADLDRDGDGLVNTYDADPDDNGVVTTTLSLPDSDGDGLANMVDLDSDNDGIPDIIEAGGVDSNGDGQVDIATDTDLDGMSDVVDTDNGGTALAIPDTDVDGIADYLDVDSDNDGITDTVENGGEDTNNDGLIDGNSSDTDGDGLANVVDPDNGGTPIANVDTDNDGIADFRDLDVDNDGYPDILEAGGSDSDNDGIVNTTLNSDPLDDAIPDNVDVDYSGTNGGSGIDSDGDEIDNSFDVDQTGGIDTDGDGIDDTYDTDVDGNGYDDAVEATPYGQEDKEGDGNKDFRDIDSDGDGIADVVEFGETVNAANAQIDGFTDSNRNGWNDAQESTPITPPNTDGDALANYRDIDSDNDGIPDNIESQTATTYAAISNNDTDADGLDDVYDPDNGGSIITPRDTDGTGNDDYLDTDADDDTVPDNIEGDNDDLNQYADWDTDNDNVITDEVGYNIDTDADGLWDVFDNNSSTTSVNVTGSNSDGQDTDSDGSWDFQDNDDDGDGLLTSSQGGGNEDSDSDGDPTNDFDDDDTNTIPNYLYGTDDGDGDSVADDVDLDSDNDGLVDTSEDGGTGIDPSGDIDGDQIPNGRDADMDGDGIANISDSDANGDSTPDSFTLTDSNNDGIADQFDKDLDGVPDYQDLDSDNDGITDLLEFGLTDSNQDGTLDEGAGLTDSNGNGLADSADPACDGASGSGNATAQTNTGATNPANAIGNTPGTFAEIANSAVLTLDMGEVVPSGNTIVLSLNDGAAGINAIADVSQSEDGTSFTNVQRYTATTGVDTAPIGPENFNYVLTSDARYIRLTEASGANRPVDVHLLSFSYTNCSGGTAVTISDTDADGIANHLDLDSDNDGITDNREAQTTASYIAPAAGDTDGDGILDVYDANNGGTAITPINSGGLAALDYLDMDSDGDGVDDNIEAFDSDQDGFASWDTDGDNLITDEIGYNVDSDNDGIWLIYDNSNGLGTIANINGANNTRQDTDADSAEDWRDNDDDGDGLLTSSQGSGNEDADSNGDPGNDFTQGGGSTPNYLFNPDVDGDGVADQTDGDSDNDGILNTDEYAGATYASGGSPFDDNDGDGIYNYLDTNDAGNTSFSDSNGDGVDDQVDQDRDGVPNFFDLDSDNDGILDAIEANDGLVPSIGSFNTTSGRFEGTDTTPNDGVVDAVAAAPLAKGNQDGGSLDDYLDLDSDNDGITDYIEAQVTSPFIAVSGNDTDGDGLDDVYDANNGGTGITPQNTDGTDEPDYRDIDSDNDTNNPGVDIVGDIIEGWDANRNGFSDLDSDLDTLLTDESGYNTDTDGDGLWDLFDNFSGFGANNIMGSAADLQDTDGDGTLDYRDVDDDADNISTATEDVNGDGKWTNDKVQGGGATPDYLFFNDSDNDRIADGQDNDGDNDGIPDDDEYDNTSFRDPFGDQDGDGVFNYNDADDPTDLVGGALTDSNNDGIWDAYDWDLDGVPNFFDLDTDNDGIPDIIEAGGVDANDDAIIDGITDSDNDGLFDNVDVNVTGGADVDGDGIDDSFDFSVSGGIDSDGDDIIDGADLDRDGDGVINTYDSDPNNNAITTTTLANPNTDGDGLRDVFDYDSDNDGIVDLVEAGGSDADGDGILDSFGDTDGDGWGNAVDSDNGGTAHALPNTDGTGSSNYLDTDSEDDGTPDWNEGFDDNENLNHIDDYTARADAYESANSSIGHYPSGTDTNTNSIPDFLDDVDSDGLPNFLDPVNNDSYYRDTDGDGIVDLFDVDQNGNFYGNVSGIPDNDSDGNANVIDGTDIPLPLDFLSFDATFEDGQVSLDWTTTNEVDVSHFEVERSVDGQRFDVLGRVEAFNIKDGVNRYGFSDGSPVNGFNYYRLLQVDFDGASEYSEIKIAVASYDKLEINIYPNPTQRMFVVEGNFPFDSSRYDLINMGGKIVRAATIEGTSRTLEIDMGGLPGGVYQLIITSPAGSQMFKIIKR